MATATYDERAINRVANELHRKGIASGLYACNCGGPQDGTGHSPDCNYVLGWDESFAEAEEEWYEANLPDEPDDTPYCNLEEYGAHD